MPDVLTAVKILAGSTVAAASVGEKSLVNAVQPIQENGKELDSTVEVTQPEILEDIAVVVDEEDQRSAEAGAADTKDSAEVIAEETSAPASAEEEEAAASSPEEASAQTVEEVGEVEAEEGVPDPKASPTEASPEDASPADEATTSTAEASAVDDTSPGEVTPSAEPSVDEASAEASGEDTVEAASTHSEGVAVVDTSQLAAASIDSELEVLSAAEPESEAPVHEAKHCHSCHSAPPAAEEVVPPTAVGGKLEVNKGAIHFYGAKEVEEVEEKSKNINCQ